ncbi:hypothetical protein ACLOJK_040349 [Asimina triloba]
MNQSFSSSSSRLAPGFRFVPEDDELIIILRRFLLEPELIDIDIPEVNFYQHPQNLAHNFEPGIGGECYFFCNIDLKNNEGSRKNRVVGDVGYWKNTSTDKTILLGEDVRGFKKTFAFHEGKPRKSKATGWVLHEYRLASPNTVVVANNNQNKVRIFSKFYLVSIL